MRARGIGPAVAGLVLLAPALAPGAGTPAGSGVDNSATVTYSDGGVAQSVSSSVAHFLVDELLDAALVATDPGERLTGTPDADVVATFRLTNTGNGVERYDLAVDATLGGDQFDPVNVRIFGDDGSGAWDPADTPIASVTLAPDAAALVYVVVDVPPSRDDNDAARLALTATAASGSGAPGTTLPGAGDGGTDAVVGSTGARGHATATLRVDTIPAATPSSVAVYRHAPGAAATPLRADGGQYDATGAGGYAPLPPPTSVSGAAIDTSAAVPLRTATVLHAGEAAFVVVTDPNRNADPSAREYVSVTVSSAGDVERLLLRETGPDTGIFAAAVQTAPGAGAGTSYDGWLAAPPGARMDVAYQDAFYPADTAQANVLVDPFGIVFDSNTGAPVNGATVTLLNADTGAPAQVFGDDGTSAYPASVVSGGAATDAGGTSYTFVPGGFRFPFVPPGNYRLVVAPPAGHVAPSSVAAGSLPPAPSGDPYAVAMGSYGDVFVVDAGPALNIDIPVDPVVSLLVLQKAASRSEVTAGDFLQYRLSVLNTDATVTAANTTITDVLPPGFRYQPGSLRRDGLAAPDPAIGVDGRTLTIGVGDIAPGATVRLEYVALVAAGVRASIATNTASAHANGGTAISNRAQASVRVRAPLFSDGFTLIGRVFESACDAAPAAQRGVPGVQLLLDDGTTVVTDDDGQYHFAGVRPGTHVVQLDLASLPEGYEVVPCLENTRFAGRADSQFVDVGGGALWRADFFVRRAAADAPPQTVREYLVRAQFDSGRATLRRDGVAEVQQLVDALRGRDLARIEVIGHTDSAPLSAATRRRFGDNHGLSLARARTVAEALQHALGLPPEKIAAVGKGADAPIASNATAAGRAQNRRTEVRVTENAAAAGADGVPADAVPPPEVSASMVVADPLARDWLAGQPPGAAWLLPEADGAAPGPYVAVAIKHAPEQMVVLRYRPGEGNSPMRFAGVSANEAGTVAVSRWRDVPLVAGRNVLEAIVVDAQGAPVQTLTRVLHWEGSVAARAELVPERSRLVADGRERPVIAVRVRDAAGRPVSRATGAFEVLPPYHAWERVEREQQRALAGFDRFRPSWRVAGDDGLALIELAPTTASGRVTLRLELDPGTPWARQQEVHAWLEPALRDWVVVGFAEGTAGYTMLKANARPPGVEDGGFTDGQVSLFAKGRVLGKWLLTLAYDSDKPGADERHRALRGTIDPDRYYTLYGDGTAQRHEAASQDKLYLKLERGQFYALFGDFDTGLTATELSRYNRTLGGVKTESGRGPVTWTAFAADTPQRFARDELQGNGTSGLYRLSQSNLVLNSDKVRIETRDRLRSERIVTSRTLARHLDYDIDPVAGTLFFREPVPSRDFDFNPVFIVIEYETLGVADKTLNAGGRVGLELLGGRVVAGMTGVHDEHALGRTTLAGADLKLQLGGATALRLEGARTEGEQGLLAPEGDAWLAELTHHDGVVDGMIYARRQDAAFGVDQQFGAESGQHKVGSALQLRVTDAWSLQAQAWHQENLASAATRNAAQGRVQYRSDAASASLGAQVVADESAAGLRRESQQATLAASRWYFDRALELRAQADAALGARNDSIDFPNRYVLGAGVAVAADARLVAAQEFTDGATFDSRTTRVGLQAVPWHGARLDTTVNQSRIDEYGPRTFAQMGLTQALLLGERWGVDVMADASRALDGSGAAPVLINPDYPVAPAGTLGAGTLTEDFTAFSLGGTYRAELWSWNGRAETRDGEIADRHGLATAWLRQARAGIAFAASSRAFEVEQAGGTRGQLASVDLSWAWRPLGSRWSVLDRLEFRLDTVRNGTGAAGSALFGHGGLVVQGDARSRRIVNNFALNRVARAWTEADRDGNLFTRAARNQWSLYYGAKYAFDDLGTLRYSGYTDLLGLELRHDLARWLDLGLQASALHVWKAGTLEYSVGPRVGVTPVDNGWIVLGYNLAGFRDEDFDAARYTAQGPYLQIRFKFDQNTRLGFDRPDPRAPLWDDAGVAP